MPVINPGEVWITDFGMAAKVRPALLLTGSPADDELDLVTVLLLGSCRAEAQRRRMAKADRRRRSTRLAMSFDSAGQFL